MLRKTSIRWCIILQN